MGQIRFKIFRGGEAKKFPGSTWPPLNIFSGYAPVIKGPRQVLVLALPPPSSPSSAETRKNPDLELRGCPPRGTIYPTTAVCELAYFWIRF